MPSAAPPSPGKKPDIDLRTLSLSQLQKLAEKGSRRARAELQRRMGEQAGMHTAAPVQPARVQAAAMPRVPRVPESAAAPMSAPVPRRPAPQMESIGHIGHPPPAMPAAAAQLLQPAVHGAVDGRARAAQAALQGAYAGVPTLTVSVNAGVQAPPAPAAGADGAVGAQQALADRLAFIARQDEERRRATGVPRLLGMALIAWGVLMLLGGLAMLRHSGGGYYICCGLGVGAAGWLLLQCRRAAIYVQAALALVGLAWGWQISNGGLLLAFIQAAPVLVASVWLLLPAARDPLE